MDIYSYIDAVELAVHAHNGQFRKFGDKEPYVAHPIRVSKNVLAVIKDWNESDRMTLAVAAILHDVIEDTTVQAGEIERAFSPKIRTLVESVTKNTALAKADKHLAGN